MRWVLRDSARELRSVWASERGTVTAEFAVVLPTVLVVLGLVVGGVYLAAHRLTLVSLSGEIARSEAREDGASAGPVLEHLGESVEVERERDGALHCVVLTSRPAQGLLAQVAVSARSCAMTLNAVP